MAEAMNFPTVHNPSRCHGTNMNKASYDSDSSCADLQMTVADLQNRSYFRGFLQISISTKISSQPSATIPFSAFVGATWSRNFHPQKQRSIRRIKRPRTSPIRTHGRGVRFLVGWAQTAEIECLDHSCLVTAVFQLFPTQTIKKAPIVNVYPYGQTNVERHFSRLSNFLGK